MFERILDKHATFASRRRDFAMNVKKQTSCASWNESRAVKRRASHEDDIDLAARPHISVYVPPKKQVVVSCSNGRSPFFGSTVRADINFAVSQLTSYLANLGHATGTQPYTASGI